MKKNKIILGDSLKLIPEIENNSIHLLLTDPPYGISFNDWDVLHNNTNSALLGSSPAQKTSKGFKRRGKPLNGWSKEDKNIGKEFENWTYNWSSKAFPKLKDGSFAFVFSSRRYLHHVINAFEKSGFILKDIVIWKKKNAQYRAQAISKVLEKRGMIKEAEKWKSWRLGNLMPIQEPIAWFFKPYKIGTTITDNVLKNETGAFNGCLENKAPSNLLEYGLDKNRIHETQKPLELIKYLIQLTTITGQTILDPFSGSGTTAVACQELKRNFICFEKNEDFFNKSLERLKL